MIKKRVLLISESMGGGLRKHVVQLIKNLDQEKFEIYFIHGIKSFDEAFSSEYETLKEYATLIPCNTFEREINPRSDWQTYIFLTKKMKEIQPDIVHCHSSKAGVLGRIVAKINRVEKIFYTPHAYSFLAPEFSKIKKELFISIEKFLTKYATTKVFCVSKGEMKQAMKVNVGNTKKMTVIYNGLPIIDFPTKNNLRMRLGLSEEKIVIGNNARMSEQKNPLLFLKIAQSVISQNEDIHFVWVGDGPLMDSMKEIVSSSSVKSNIHLLGDRNDTEVLVSGYDIYLTTSLYEGLPYSLIEALRAGIKIIGTNVVGNDELIFENNQFDLDDIGKAISLLSENINLFDEGKAEIRKFENFFTIGKMISSIESNYEK